MTAPVRKNLMISSRQQAYLDAMGIGVWSLRDAAPPGVAVETQAEAVAAELKTPQEILVDTLVETPVVPAATADSPGLKLGPGGGGILLVCAVDTDSASRLANDISRALGSVPVWAWPHADSAAVKLTKAVEENLFTTVGVFGDEVARQFFDGDLPDSLQSANLVLLPSMQDIQHRAEARQLLWAAFCRSGMVSVREHKA